MKPLHARKAILPWWKMALLLAGCAVGTYLLMPDDAQLVEDLLHDGKVPQARRQLDRVPLAARSTQANRYRRLELQIARREVTASDAAARARLWRDAVAAWRDSDFSAEVAAELPPVLALHDDPASAWEVVQADLGRAPAPQVRRLAGEFVRAALAANQPATAARAFAAAHPAQQRSASAARELARLWQLAGDPAAALASLGSDASPELVARRLELLRALNQNREALALLQARADAAPAGELTSADVEELVTAALQSGQAAVAVPYLQRFVDRHPADLTALRRLRDLQIAAGTAVSAAPAAARAVTLGGGAPDDVRAQARILEWTGNPSGAFAAWLVLARDGDLAAIDRLIALNPGLYRDRDLAHALSRVVPVTGRPEYTLQLARLEVSLGSYDEALGHYTQYLAVQGESVDTLVEVARIQAELNRFAAAEERLNRALRLRPGDAGLQRELAAVLVWLGRNQEALALYAHLAENSSAEEILDPYSRLAESLGRYDELARAIRRRIARATEPSARDYLMLAYAHELDAAPAARRAALEEGLRVLPDSDELRLQLASALSDERKYVDAQAVLSRHRRLREEPIAAALYLDLMRLNNDQAAERRFLAVPIAGALALDENVRERAAQAYEVLRDFSPAEALRRGLLAERPDDPSRVADLARVLLLAGRTREAGALLDPLLRHPTPALLRLAAEVAMATGNFRAAENYQAAYLAASYPAAAAEWSTLGDIRLSRGNRSGAKSAYAEALRQLQSQWTPTGAPP